MIRAFLGITCSGAVLLGACANAVLMDPSDTAHVVLPEVEIPSQPPRPWEDLTRALEDRAWDRALEAVDRIQRDGNLVAEGIVYADPYRMLMETLAGAPPEFFERYRSRFDPDAPECHRMETHPKLWIRYFFCTGMDLVGDRIARRFLDEGKPQQALEIWEAILRFFPDSALPTLVLAARALLAASLADDPEALERIPCSEGEIRIGHTRTTLRKWKHSLRPSRIPSNPLPVSADTVSWESVEGDWRAVLRWQGVNVPLFTLRGPSFTLPKLVLSVWNGRFLWAAPGPVAGIIDLSELREIWVGPLDCAPLPSRLRRSIAAQVASTTRLPLLLKSLELQSWFAWKGGRSSGMLWYDDDGSVTVSYEPLCDCPPSKLSGLFLYRYLVLACPHGQGFAINPDLQCSEFQSIHEAAESLGIPRNVLQRLWKP